MPDTIHDCWNRIGVWGNSECLKLDEHVHCRNCPVYSTAATRLLNQAPAATYLDERTAQVAERRQVGDRGRKSAMIFRIESEWFALATAVFREAAPWRRPHWIPHLRDRLVLGVVNIRGELLVCVSMARALELDESGGAGARLLVISDNGERLAFPVAEVGGVHHFSPDEVRPPPATLAASSATHVSGVLSWRNRTVGQLDEQLLFYTFNKRLA